MINLLFFAGSFIYTLAKSKIYFMKKLVLLLSLVCAINLTQAQVSQGGEPMRWEDKKLDDAIPFLQTAPIDLDYLAMEDAITDQDSKLPFRFGVEFEESHGLNEGLWLTDPSNEEAIWLLGVHCPGARTINFIFSQYHLVKGASLFIWSANRQQFLGAFNEKNNTDANVLGTTVIAADQVVLELHVPLSRINEVQLEIGTIVHGYRPVLVSHFDEDRGPYGTSGACNNNINCPVGADWQVEKRAVALILDGGFASCTGALVNNTANDGTPYFLTANHCYGNTTTSWVFVFNHEASTCTGTTGPTNQTVSGCTLRAKNAGSDFCLVELSAVPPATYNVQYAGWDASDANTVSAAIGIHHPSGDLKKISFENEAPALGTWSGAQTWNVAQWDDGITEPGSSGSPLFDQNHRIIGQLYGGGSACSGAVENGQGDSYGRFGVSWDAGTSAATRLKEWLDPGNTGVLVLDGYPDGFTPLALDAGASAISGLSANTCDPVATPIVTLLNQGLNPLTSCVIQYQINGGAFNNFPWTGNLNQGQTVDITLPSITLSAGANTISVTVINPNNGTDENNNNNSISFQANLIDVGLAAGVPYINYLTNATFPYAGWQLNNPDADITWEQTTVTNGGGVLKYDCYNYNAAGEEDDFITSPFQLSNFTSFSLKFKVAHRRYSNNYTDGLKVSIATDCDGPWTEVYNKSGANLATASNSTQDYLVPSLSEWRQECVDVSDFALSNVLVKFTGVNGYGNNIFVDDIEVVNTDCQGVVSLEERNQTHQVSIYPNPSGSKATLSMTGWLDNKLSVEVFNMLGEKVISMEGLSVSGNYNISLDATGLSNGIYLVKMRGDHSSAATRWEIR